MPGVKLRPLSLPEGEALWRLHQGLPGWFAEVAARLARVSHRSASLYALRQSMGNEAISIRDMREALRAFVPAGLRFGGGTRYRISVPAGLRAFWQQVVAPGLDADAATLVSYMIHLSAMTKARLRADPDLGRLGRPPAWRGKVHALRCELLRELFARPDMVRQRARRLGLPPGGSHMELPFREGWTAAAHLCAHPCCCDGGGGLRIRWLTVKAAAPPCLPSRTPAVPYARCLPALRISGQAAGTWQQEALNAALADANAATLLRWWARCVPDQACVVQNGRLYADARGGWHPLFVDVSSPRQWQRLLQHLVAVKAIAMDGQGWRLTELGLTAGRGEAPPRRLVRAVWSRVSDKLTLRLSRDWPAEAQALVQQVGTAGADGIVVTPHSLRSSGMSPEAALALLGRVCVLSPRVRGKLLAWARSARRATP